MSRVDEITIFLVIVITVYTTLAGGLVAAYAGLDYETEDNDLDIYDVLNFEDIETQNISKPAIPIFPNTEYFSTLSPERRFSWRVELLSDDFVYCEAQGIGFPANLIWNNLTPEGLPTDDFGYSGVLSGVGETYLTENFQSEKNYTHLIFNKGGRLETHALVSPQFNYNGTHITYLYDNMTAAIAAGELTVTLGINVTYVEAFDPSRIIGQMVTFGAIYSDMPSQVNMLISGIWWALIIILGVKLVVG